MPSLILRGRPCHSAGLRRIKRGTTVTAMATMAAITITITMTAIMAMVIGINAFPYRLMAALTC